MSSIRSKNRKRIKSRGFSWNIGKCWRKSRNRIRSKTRSWNRGSSRSMCWSRSPSPPVLDPGAPPSLPALTKPLPQPLALCPCPGLAQSLGTQPAPAAQETAGAPGVQGGELQPALSPPTGDYFHILRLHSHLVTPELNAHSSKTSFTFNLLNSQNLL